MIYFPRSDFLFIHIPRTAGNTITRTLGIEKLLYDEVILSTMHSKPIARHCFLSQFVEVFKPNIYKELNVIVIDRNIEDIIYSSYVLWQHANYIENIDEKETNYNKIVLAARESFQKFKEAHWSKILSEKNTLLERWIDCEYDFIKVHVIPYDDLKNQWNYICELAKCKQIPKLINYDYQKEYFIQEKIRIEEMKLYEGD